MNWLNPARWLLLIALCASCALGLQTWTNRLIERGDAAGYARGHQEATDASAAARKAAAAETAALQKAADTAREETTHALQDLDRTHRALADSLRNRLQRPGIANLPASAGIGADSPGCTGARLYRQDAEFLAGEAARAKSLSIYLKACRAAYDKALQAMNESMP